MVGGTFRLLRSFSTIVVMTSRQVRLTVINKYSTSSTHVTKALTRTKVWLTNRMDWVFACARRLARRSWEWLKSHTARIFLILSILFVVLVGVTVIGLIISALLFPLTSEYTLAARYSYIFRATAMLVSREWSPPFQTRK
jgi:hypothetical protein